MIQVLRSLGDVGFHKKGEDGSGPILTCEPESIIKNIGNNVIF